MSPFYNYHYLFFLVSIYTVYENKPLQMEEFSQVSMCIHVVQRAYFPPKCMYVCVLGVSGDLLRACSKHAFSNEASVSRTVAWTQWTQNYAPNPTLAFSPVLYVLYDLYICVCVRSYCLAQEEWEGWSPWKCLKPPDTCASAVSSYLLIQTAQLVSVYACLCV